MGRVIVLGESLQVAGFALGGAVTLPADDAESVRRRWEALPDDTSVVVLSASAAAALGARPSGRPDVLTVTMPE